MSKSSSFRRAKVSVSTRPFNSGHRLPARSFLVQPQSQPTKRPYSSEEIERIQQLDAGVMQTLNLQAKRAIAESGNSQPLDAPRRSSGASVAGELAEQEQKEKEADLREVSQKNPRVRELRMKQNVVVQRDAMSEKDENVQLEPMVQDVRAGGSAVSENLEGEVNRARGGGQGLEPELKTQMGQMLGADLSGVRVHTDRRADQLNSMVGARAFTTGQDLFFKRGEYQPGSRGGQELIAHELTHVMQQGGAESTIQQDTTRSTVPFNQEKVAGILQRSEVKVAGGAFKTEESKEVVKDISSGADQLIYAPMKGLFNPDEPQAGMQVGAIMKLRFVPKGELKPRDMTAQPTRVSLVQTVHDQLHVGDAPVDRPAAAFGLRETKGGPVIDQTIYSDYGEGGIENLDPRYTETRKSEEEPLTRAGSSVKGTAGHSVDSDNNDLWTKGALLRDNPGAVNPKSLSGGMSFEVAALVETYNPETGNIERVFAGSVAWGWKAAGQDGLEPEIDPMPLALVDEGAGSDQFFDAVAAWNAMEVPTHRGDRAGAKESPLQLPPRGGAEIPSGPREAPVPKLKSAQLELFCENENQWTALTPDEFVDALKKFGSLPPQAEEHIRTKMGLPAKGMVGKMKATSELNTLKSLL